MTEDRHIDEVLDELGLQLNDILQTMFELKALKNKGIQMVDEDWNPVVPENVVMFPAHRRIQ
jgi:hypothetical protein